YVTMSHYPPGLDFSEPDYVWITVKIHNYGRTPADVLGGTISLFLSEEHDRPPASVEPARSYSGVPPVMLVTGDHVDFRTLLSLSSDELQSVRAGDNHLWVVGHVDYLDRFKGKHRAGYARHFNRFSQELIFDRSTQGLNFDRMPTKDEKKRGWGQV